MGLHRPEGRARLVRFLGLSDVRANAWYGDALDWLTEQDIVSGFPDGTFRPQDAAKRAQMANWLYLLAGSEDAWA